MKKIVVSLSFDDGRKDNYYNVLPLLEKYSIPATFNISTGYVERRILPQVLFCNNEPMTPEQVIEMSHHNLVEIACHGDLHSNNFDDILKNKAIIEEWLGLGEKVPLGFASPNSKMHLDFVNSNKHFFLENNIIYVRSGANLNTYDFKKRIVSKMSRCITLPYFYKLANKQNLITNLKHYEIFVNSVPVLHNNTIQQVEYLIEYCIKYSKSVIFMFHSILKTNEVNSECICSWEYKNFLKLCDFLSNKRKNNEIEIMKTKDMINAISSNANE